MTEIPSTAPVPAGRHAGYGRGWLALIALAVVLCGPGCAADPAPGAAPAAAAATGNDGTGDAVATDAQGTAPQSDSRTPDIPQAPRPAARIHRAC